VSSSAAPVSAELAALRIAQALVVDMAAIASPPEVCLKLNLLLGDERVTIEEITTVMLRDPGLVARVLRLANSPLYGHATRIDTVSRAVMVLGLAELQKLVCALSAVETFSRLSSAVTNMNAFWRHGVYTGLLAQSIARRLRVLRPERLFVAGVMHDIGTLIVNHRYPEMAEELIRHARGDEDRLYALEYAELGFEHALLGGLMLAHWQLPASVVDAITHHHAPERAREAQVEAAILQVAERLANASGTGSFSELRNPLPGFDTSALSRLGFTVNFEDEDLLDEVDQDFVAAICLFLP
jgi:HD-like signal output (HDOD) protein